MRVLYCNKYDYPFSGTEAYLFELIRQMEERGHTTALFSMAHGRPSAFGGRSYRIPYLDFKDPGAGFWKKARMAAHALYSISARCAMRACLDDYGPDVAHIRGIYHHLSPSILWELKRQGVPVLYHLNDFKDSLPYLQSCGRRPRLRIVQRWCVLPRAHQGMLRGTAQQRRRSGRRSLPAQMVADL